MLVTCVRGWQDGEACAARSGSVVPALRTDHGVHHKVGPGDRQHLNHRPQIGRAHV